MSERMTSIRLRTSRHSGLADYGRQSIPEMVRQIRQMAEHELEWAKEVLAARDEDFHVETYKGLIVRRNREVLQEGLPKNQPRKVNGPQEETAP